MHGCSAARWALARQPWRGAFARFLLAGDTGGMFGPPDTLDVPEDNPTVRRLRAGADGGLLVVRRGPDDKGNLRRDITVDVMRRLHGFFGLSAADGGQRVVIVDAADESMNTNAANALLKALEEPPANATAAAGVASALAVVAHNPIALPGICGCRRLARMISPPPLPKPGSMATRRPWPNCPAGRSAKRWNWHLAAGQRFTPRWSRYSPPCPAWTARGRCDWQNR